MKKILSGLALIIALSGCGNNDNIPVNNNMIIKAPTSGYKSSSFATYDVDRDGDLDFFIAETDGKVFFYENLGKGNFSKNLNPIINLPTSGYKSSSFSIGDYDGDGKPEILGAKTNGEIYNFGNLNIR